MLTPRQRVITYTAFVHHVQGTAIIRPRERRPVPVAFQIALITDHHGKYLQWTLTTRPSVITESHLAD